MSVKRSLFVLLLALALLVASVVSAAPAPEDKKSHDDAKKPDKKDDGKDAPHHWRKPRVTKTATAFVTVTQVKNVTTTLVPTLIPGPLLPCKLPMVKHHDGEGKKHHDGLIFYFEDGGKKDGYEVSFAIGCGSGYPSR